MNRREQYRIHKRIIKKHAKKLQKQLLVFQRRYQLYVRNVATAESVSVVGSLGTTRLLLASLFGHAK